MNLRLLYICTQIVLILHALHASSCKYLGIILRRDLSWADQVNYTVKKPGRFVLH
jgi:hypothetical protein